MLAIDTEFVRERTYVPELCLVQIATEDLCVCIDCLSGLDLKSLFDALASPDRPWILHSARQDLEVIWNSSERLPAKLIDTQIAGALVGFAPQLGLQDLLLEILGVRLDKHHTRTDWTRRPLADAVLEYALDDVRYLLPAWRELESRLSRLDRIDWFEEDCRRPINEPPVSDLVTIARRLRGLGDLSEEQKSAAAALVEWREARARARNRPRRWILSDDGLLGIARGMPADLAALARIPGLPSKLVARSGEEILAAISARARHSRVAEQLGATDRPDKAVVARLKNQVNHRAAALGIHSEVLATRKDLAAIATGETPDAFRSGWRAVQLKTADADLS